MSRLHDDKSHHEKTDGLHLPPKPIIKKMRWPFPLIWIVPLIAAGIAFYYFHDQLMDRGPEITLRFADVDGLKPGDTKVEHLGVQIGQVISVELSADKNQALAHVRLRRTDDAFARKGAAFWIVRPEISTQQISGLGTVLSGPIIEASPGNGETQTEFVGQDKPPKPAKDGLNIVLKAPNAEHLQSDSPVYFRGIQVGSVGEIQLNADGTTADIHAFIEKRFVPLVKTNSQFWAVSAVDLHGGLFSGVEMKVESLRSVISGGVAFATPEEDMGQQWQNGSTFVLHNEVDKDWLSWSPKIPIEPENSRNNDLNASLPQAPDAIRSAVGPK